MNRLSLLFVGAMSGMMAVNLQAQTSLQRVATGLSAGLYATAHESDSNRVFYLEQGSGSTGRIRVQNKTTGALSTYLNVTGIRTGGERGLLGLAFHPDFDSNGKFYTYNSINGGSQNHLSEIREYTVNGNPLTSTSINSSFSTVLRFSQPFSNHNGGWIGFRPGDGSNLYVASGDGGSGGDPGNRSQDITNQLLGKMLRINVDGDDFGSDPLKNYSIPADNPFVGSTGDDEIWSYGLRNPYRSSFDRATGDMWIGDVGQNAREEIDWEPAGTPGGLNYGWKVEEGFNCFSNTQQGGNPPCGDPSLVEPIYDYGHGNGTFQGNSVTGGYVYRGSVDQFEGLYFFGDFASDHIWTMDPYAIDPAATVTNRDSQLNTNAGSLAGLSSFGEDADGELYVTSYFTGEAFRLSTTAQTATWNGDDATAGAAGNGSTWNSANNWTRGTNVDTAVVNNDSVVFAPGSATGTILLGGSRSVAAATFQADYTLASGTLRVLSGNVHVDAGVTARIAAGTTLSSETSNTSIRKLGTGTLAMNGSAGQVAVLDGTVAGGGTVDYLTVYAGAIAQPTGSLNVNNDFTLREGATLAVQIGGPTAPNQIAANVANLDGNLVITSAGPITPAMRGTMDSYLVLDASAISGEFDLATYNGEILDADGGNEFSGHAGNGIFASVSEIGNGDIVVENYYALPGDANGDGVVDVSDLNIWNTNKFLTGTDWTTADFNGDGLTDVTDLNIWNSNKFRSVSLVPEPNSWILLSMGGSLWLLRRKRL